MAVPAMAPEQQLGLAARLALAVVSPVSRLWSKPSPTHDFINEQALKILEADGRGEVAALLRPHVAHLQQGCAWADGGSRNVTHMYDPVRGRGMRGWPDAVSVCTEFFNQAVNEWLRGQRESAVFYLGAACHLVQDLCVPHHAACRLLDGHREFERLARARRRHHAVRSGGLYGLAREAGGWVIENARVARTYLALADSRATGAMKEVALSVLLPRAQQTTAGFLAFFAAEVTGR